MDDIIVTRNNDSEDEPLVQRRDIIAFTTCFQDQKRKCFIKKTIKRQSRKHLSMFQEKSLFRRDVVIQSEKKFCYLCEQYIHTVQPLPEHC